MEAAEDMGGSSLPAWKYWIASVKSESVVISVTSPSSSLYAIAYEVAYREKHCSTWQIVIIRYSYFKEE
jgi:hypothetical protein